MLTSLIRENIDEKSRFSQIKFRLSPIFRVFNIFNTCQIIHRTRIEQNKNDDNLIDKIVTK